MILGTDSIGVLNIGSDDNTVYGVQTYSQPSTANLKIAISAYVNGLYNELVEYDETQKASLKITGGYNGDWGYVHSINDALNAKISAVSNLGFVYTQFSVPKLKLTTTYTTSSLQSDTQPFNLLTSAQSRMAWYTFNLQDFEQVPVKLRLNGTSVDYYLSINDISTGGGSGNIEQIWIG
jgi:hypothetical protein